MEKQYQNWYLQYTSSGTSIDEYSGSIILVLVDLLHVVRYQYRYGTSTGTGISGGTSTGNQKCGLPPRSQAGRVTKIWDQSCTCGFWFSVDFLPKLRYSSCLASIENRTFYRGDLLTTCGMS